MVPDWASGFWQCKLRYASQEELISVAEEYHRRKLPLPVIVIGYFLWTRQGDWQFNPKDWPDPDGIWGIEIFVCRSGGSVRADGELAIPHPFSRGGEMKVKQPEEIQLFYYAGFTSRAFGIQSANTRADNM